MSELKPKLYSLAEIRQARFPRPQPIVEGLLAEGETILLVGRPKIGKSRLTQQLTLCMSRGEPFLGMAVPRPRRVLYLDLENRRSGVQSRFSAMSKPHPNDAMVFVYAPDTLAENPFVASSAGIVSLANAVEDFSPDLLIVDPWRLFVGGDGNKEDIVMNGLKVLSELRRKHPKLALILIHHLRKQHDSGAPNRITLRNDPSSWVEAASGHYALIGHSDATFGLERERNQSGEELIVFGGIARTVSPPTLLLEEDDGTLLFRLTDSAEAAIKCFTAAERSIWDVAISLREFSYSELVRASGTTNKRAMKGALDKAARYHLLEHEGQLYRVVSGDSAPAFVAEAA